eukprot:scaffold168722_cov48-Attheya_sp.AAC.4
MLECAIQLPTSPVHYDSCHPPCASTCSFCSIADGFIVRLVLLVGYTVHSLPVSYIGSFSCMR